MCNRVSAREIDFHRLAAVITSLPPFKQVAGGGAGGSTAAALSAAEPQPDETSPGDRTRVIRVVDNQVRTDLLKWGLVPPHAPEPKVDYATFNAKAETITTAPTFRHAWRERQRCLVPVNAFFEWKGSKPPKQKYRISVRGESQFCLAGLWEKWNQGDQVLETFTIITVPANELVAEIHDKKRMPVILATRDYGQWLFSPSDVRSLLAPYPAELMEAVPVGKRVTPRDDGPSLFSAGE